jgi:hypothetical protein
MPQFMGAAATYQVDNFEYVTSFYTSPSIQSYFQSVPYALSFTDCDHRVYTLLAGQTQFNVQVPSNFRSLRSVIAVARPSDIDTDFQASNSFCTYDPLGGKNTSWNLSINGFKLWQEDVSGRDQFHNELRRCFGDGVLQSTFVKDGTEFSTDKFIMAAQLESMGGLSDYAGGSRANQHVSSLTIHITTDEPLAESKELDVFMLYDKLLSINSGRLQVIM